MKLLHVSSSYPLHERDSTAPFMEEMLSALVDAGHEVTVVVPRVSGLQEGLRAGVQVVGVPYAPTGLQNWGYGRSLNGDGTLKKSALAATPFALAGMSATVRRRVRAWQPDAVHLHWALPQGVIGLWMPRDVPVVISIHGADAKFMTGRLQPLAARVLRRADAVVAASSGVMEVAAAVEPMGDTRRKVIRHGANAAIFGEVDRFRARAQLGVAADQELIVAVGRLVSKKGFHVLIEAVQGIDVPPRVVILGDGPERSRLEALDPEVSFLGTTGRLEVATWLAAADIVVIPSIVADGDLDTGPVVLMEAMAAGRPVVATPVGMAPDVIETGVNGILVESDDSAALAEGISRALRSADEMGANARETFEAIGDWQRVAGELDLVYKMAISRRKALSD